MANDPNKKYILFVFGEHFVDGKKTDILIRGNEGCPMTLEELEEEITNLTNPTAAGIYFNGCDFNTHISIIDGKPDYLKGVVLADVMGQQILELLPLNEQDMMDTIIAEFEKNHKHNVLELGDVNDIKATYWDENTGITKYKPLTIVKRIYEEEPVYDVECISIDNNGEEANYVDNLEYIGFLILFNIYLCITRK